MPGLTKNSLKMKSKRTRSFVKKVANRVKRDGKRMITVSRGGIRL